MASIYAVYSEDEILYVGSTCRPIEKRIYSHMCSKQPKYALSRIKDWSNVQYTILDTVPLDEMRETEGFYINWLEPKYNRRGAGISDSECKRRWRLNNRQRQAEYLKVWRARQRIANLTEDP
jgi:Uri superfamily endonuclease